MKPRAKTPGISHKELRRAAKKLDAISKQQITPTPDVEYLRSEGPVDCACVIHGDVYSWNYVDILYNMLTRHLSQGVRMHVYTEKHRAVPEHMIKHELIEWPGIKGHKKSWWYKMQLFNPEHHSGPLLYLDLDTVVVNNLDWIPALSLTRFWAIRDFKKLWTPEFQGINSSVMYWHTEKFKEIWTKFSGQDINQVCKRYHGDQDYLSDILPPVHRRFFPDKSALSWRWQALDGGMDPYKRKYYAPGTGTQIDPDTSLLIFHGQPKPDRVKDPVIKAHWQ